jgi:hypothetical protein
MSTDLAIVLIAFACLANTAAIVLVARALHVHISHPVRVPSAPRGDDSLTGPRGGGCRSGSQQLHQHRIAAARRSPTRDPRRATEHKEYRMNLAQTVLGALQGKHVYGGTVPDHVVAKRRARNKAARRSRRINRTSR